MVSAGEGRVTVQLVQSGDVIERPAKLVERPLETHPSQMWDRMAYAAAAAEEEGRHAQWERAFRWALDGFRFVPGGRISTMLGTGQNLTAFNCYVIPLQPDAGPENADSRRSIIDTLGRMVEIMSRGGGVGINLSTLRPQLAPVRGVNGRSSGSVSWGGLFSFATGLVEQGGSRRGALMVMLDDWHPDLLRFIRAKQAMGAITNANMSVCVSDAFMRAVREDGEWELVFPDTSDPDYDRLWDGDLNAWRERGKPVEVHERVRAREVWNEIVTSAWKSAEPGVVFIDRYNEYSNARYYARIACTNPCFAGPTRLATAQGYLTMEELYRAGTSLWVATDGRAAGTLEEAVGGGRYTPPGVTLRPAGPAFLTRRNAPVLRLETAHGLSVTATPDHRFLTPAGYVELQDLHPGDVLYLQSGEGAWARDDRLPDTARPARREGRLEARMSRDEATPPERWTREVGQFLGWATGGGYTYDNRGKPVLALLFGPAETELIPRFRGLVRGWFGVEGSVSTRNQTVRLQYDASVARFARALGLEARRAPEKRVPESLWQAPREAVVGFLQGLFTSNGAVNVSAAKGSCNVRLASSSRELLADVQLLLLNLGIVSRLHLRRRPGLQILPDGRRRPRAHATAGQHELLIDKANRDRFAREVGFLSRAKQERLEAFISAKTRRSNGEPFTTRVVRVVPAGRANVYDLTEPVTHSVIAGGLVAHNCGEQGLPPFGVCNLGHVNLARFVEGPAGEARVLWDELARAVWLGVRFLDNVIDITPYFLAENEALQKGERRVGLGTMGLGEMLIRLGIRYGSDESLAFMDRLYGFIARHAYRASVHLAQEKGTFPRFQADGFLSSAFMRAMPHEIQEAVRAHGIRNVTLITQAPTGTTGSMVGTSTGIEPYYSWTYYRKGRLGRKRVVEPVVADVLGLGPEEAERLDLSETRLPGAFVTALELTPEEHVRVQAVAQRWCDSSISKTANLPADYSVEQTEAIYRLAYELGCKGVTIYRDRSRDEQVLSTT
ncbi:hypothetical protein LIP_0715 [Limnochorda pilosa]|uniref:DOD-type homing endonuclease domain-containing protein n=1 Tax=Limnochorda pilosa TaxID=1555112 RepID=A0A0K2SHQ8_LIMPI|nr:hypothetical protein LIP_0715 [Limnochorda pilosa]